MRQHAPIIHTTCAALVSMLGVALLHRDAVVSAHLSSALACFAVGVLYTQFFEYWAHRVPMHRRVRFLEGIRLSHLRHHRKFHGERFQTRDAEDLQHIAGRFWAYPTLFALHYAALIVWLPSRFVVPFLAGTCAHYVVFELSHWLTHIENNAVDRALFRIPWLGTMRAYQIEHHRKHHELPATRFNFNPPYLGDRLIPDPVLPARTAPAPRVQPPPEPVAAPPAPPNPALPPFRGPEIPVWQARALRYGSVAAAGVALVGVAFLARSWTGQGRGVESAELP